MREILFRGKSNWSYGNTKEGDWLYGMTISRHCYNDEEITSYYIGGGNKTIHAKTLGQYTGLTDKNGNKIFEGDIVKYKNTGGISFNGVTLTVIGKVVYNEKTTSFAVFGKDEIGAKHCDYFPIQNIEVIGNIHDNPELLKENDNDE